MANIKVLNKKISTKDEGVFYKEIVNENSKGNHSAQQKV